MTTIAPARLSLIVTEPRCVFCGKKLADYVTVPFRFQCARCKKVTERVE